MIHLSTPAYPTLESLEKNLLKTAAEAKGVMILRYENPNNEEIKSRFPLASFIDTYVKTNGINSSLCQDVYNAISATVNTKLLYFKDFIHISCLLDLINHSELDPNDLIYDRVMDQLEYEMKIDSRQTHVDRLDVVMGLFTLRKVKRKTDDLFFEFCRKIFNSVDELSPLEISLTVKALAQSNYKNFRLWEKLRNRTFSINQHFKVNEAVNTIWSFIYPESKKTETSQYVRAANENLAHCFLPKLTKEIDVLPAEQIIRIGWCYNTINFTDQNFFTAVKDNIQKVKENLIPPELTNAIKCFTQTGGCNDRVLIELLELFLKKMNQDIFSIGGIVSAAYSVLIKFCARDKNFTFYTQFIIEALEKIDTMDFSSLIDFQHQNIETLVLIFNGLTQNTHTDLTSRIAEKIKKSPFKQPNSSFFHKTVASYIEPLLKKEFQIVHEYNFATHFSLDMALPEIKLAIEVDGNWHMDEKKNYVPKTIVKDTLLNLMGWNLVRISYLEWENAKGLIDKIKLIKEKLAPFSILKQGGAFTSSRLWRKGFRR